MFGNCERCGQSNATISGVLGGRYCSDCQRVVSRELGGFIADMLACTRDHKRDLRAGDWDDPRRSTRWN